MTTNGGGIAPIHYEWRRNGTPLPAGEQPGGPVLTLDVLATGDAGVYDVVIADSGADSVTSDAALLLVTPAADHLVITQQPKDTVAGVGGSASFNVTVSGAVGALTYQWKFDDGTPAGLDVGTDSDTLMLDPVAAGDFGQYWVEVSDATSDVVVSDTATLHQGTPLAVTTHPQGLRAYAEDVTDYTMTAAVEGGTGTLTYQWLKDGQPAPGGNTGLSYTISDAAVADSGSYAFTATDDFGTVTSDPAVVELGERMTIATQPQGGEVASGATFTFSVAVHGGLGALHYQWKFSGAAKQENIGEDAPQLVLEDVQPADAGSYWVEINDDLDAVVSDAAQLEVTTGLPVAGPLALALLAAALAIRGGLGGIRKKRGRG